MPKEESKKVLVYVQAIPVSVPGGARSFRDFERSSEFRMSHSSKAALSLAASIFQVKIVAAGFSPILREAVARGSDGIWSMPLCDDPVDQASFFPKDIQSYDHLILGENCDWVFSGASLAGVLAKSNGISIDVSSQCATTRQTVMLVKDSGKNRSMVDIRRLGLAEGTTINPDGVLGDSSLVKMELKKPEFLSGETLEISSTLARRIRRIHSE